MVKSSNIANFYEKEIDTKNVIITLNTLFSMTSHVSTLTIKTESRRLTNSNKFS